VGAAYEHPDPDWKHALIAGWSGLRGSVSLAAALAIPVTIASGAPLAHRHLVIFLTFSVILVTLVGGGLTLPLLISALGVREEAPEEESELRRAVTAMANAALARIEELARERKITADAARRLRTKYEHKRDHAEGHSADEYDELGAEVLLIAAERATLVAMRRRGEIDNTVLRSLQHDLDISEERIKSHR
jgi:NhaP-type Na+/H+ or K+/H+ antiporter